MGQRSLLLLVAGALFVPIAIVVVLAVAGLLGAMQDEPGQYALKRVALALGVFWTLDLIGLLIIVALQALAAEGDEPRDEG